MKFRLFLENDEDKKIQKLGNELKNLDLKNYSIVGHGTSNPEIAQNIVKTGLRYSEPNLNRQTIPLFDSTIPIEKQTNNLKTILNWGHKNSKAIVVIGIPNPPDDQAAGLLYFQSVWDEIPEDKLTDLYGNPTSKNSFKYIIKPHYIMGYIDANTASFYPNPKFNPPPIERTDKWWGQPPKFRNTAKNQSEHTPIPMPNNSSSSLVDIW